MAHLPLHSASVTAQSGAPQWSETEFLLARLVNLTIAATPWDGKAPAQVRPPLDRIAEQRRISERTRLLREFAADEARRRGEV